MGVEGVHQPGLQEGLQALGDSLKSPGHLLKVMATAHPHPKSAAAGLPAHLPPSLRDGPRPLPARPGLPAQGPQQAPGPAITSPTPSRRWSRNSGMLGAECQAPLLAPPSRHTGRLRSESDPTGGGVGAPGARPAASQPCAASHASCPRTRDRPLQPSQPNTWGWRGCPAQGAGRVSGHRRGGSGSGPAGCPG